MHVVNLVLVAFAASCVAAEVEKEEGVLVLTNDNFDEVIKANEFVLVEFYAPWCGHCKALAPQYAKAAQELEADGSSVKLGKVDATVHGDLASKFNVQGYPTLKFFRNGKPVDYNGPRESDGIVAWLRKKTGPAITVVTEEEMNKAKEGAKIMLVFYGKEESGKEYEAYLAAASASDNMFLQVKSGEPKMKMMRKFDEPELEYTGKWESEAILEFIKVNRVPLVTEFSQESAQAVFESEIKMHILAFLSKKAKEYDSQYKLLTDVAKELKGKIHVIVLNMDEEEGVRISEYFGVSASDMPTYRILDMKEDMVKYKPESSDFTASAISGFTKKVMAGDVKPHLKSQEEPADWDASPVKVLVAKAFEKRAITADKAVFVEFYAPWCGHCKALAPIWDELGEEFKDDDSVLIAKMDSTENELEIVKIQSFPTLKFSPKGRTDFIDYEGGRTKEDFVKYIKSNGEEVSNAKKDEKHDEL